MELQKQVCNQELSKKLRKLGVSQKSYFYWVITLTTDYHISIYDGELPDCLLCRNDVYSAFTVAELGEMLGLFTNTHKNASGTWVVSWNGQGNDIGKSDDTEADARAKMLIYLLENNLINLKI